MREFNWCRQEIAEDCRWGGDHVHIAITSLWNRRITPSCGKVVLHVLFNEVLRNDVSDDPSRGQDRIEGCFREEHAREIIRFVNGTNKDETVIVNCEAGVSRSPAVVLAFRKFQGQDTESVFKKAAPNIHVASVLGRLLGVGPFQAPKYEGLINPFATDEGKS